MTGKSWYALSTKGVAKRYGLSKNITSLLQALDEHHMGSTEAHELGRLVRHSRNRRSAIANTIAKCAQMIKTQPEEVKTCVELIEMCTEILEIVDRPPPSDGFPFMKLPVEIRARVFEVAVDTLFSPKGSVIPSQRRVSCSCPKTWHEPLQPHTMKALFALQGPQTNEEFFRVLFLKKTAHFRCPCELHACIAEHRYLAGSVRRILVQWSGPLSAKAFEKLADCTKLESLSLVLSKGTLWHLNEREKLIRESFPNSTTRLTDVLGLNELLKVRGLQEVTVVNYGGRGMNIYEPDRASLEKLLNSFMKLPRED